jgi:hypothetical protein
LKNPSESKASFSRIESAAVIPTKHQQRRDLAELSNVVKEASRQARAFFITPADSLGPLTLATQRTTSPNILENKQKPERSCDLARLCFSVVVCPVLSHFGPLYAFSLHQRRKGLELDHQQDWLRFGFLFPALCSPWLSLVIFRLFKRFLFRWLVLVLVLSGPSARSAAFGLPSARSAAFAPFPSLLGLFAPDRF